MNSLTKVLGILMALMLSAFALPASAADPQKIYSINVSPLGTAPVAVTIKNETPNGNSTVNSFIISPPPGVTVAIASPASSASANVTLGSDGKVYVNSFDGLKAGNKSPKTLTINLNATYGSGAACGAGLTWTAVVYTGNSFGAETFDPVVGTNPPTNATQSATCNYSLKMAPASVSAGTSTTLTATLKNESPAGSPAITSATLAAATGLTITSVTPPAGTTATSSAGSVNVSSTSIPAGGSIVLTIAVDTACVASSGSWGSTANSGAFTRLAGSSSLGTAVTGTCAMTLTQPSNVVAGVAIAPPVVAQLNGATGAAVPWFGGNVTMNTGGCGVGTVASMAATGGVATFSSIVLSTAGSYTLTACAGSFSQTSASFMVFAGTLNCGDTFDSSAPGATDVTKPGYAAGERGGFNKDRAACVPVGYTFANNIVSNNSVLLTWNVASQPGAAFKSTMTWKPEYVNALTGMPARITRVAWYNSMGILGPLVPGRACLSPDLPFPYGTVGAVTIAAGDLMIGVTASIPVPTPPFPIQINNERMTVTAVSGSSWTVVRGVGGTTAAIHNPGANVMSTPLPLDGAGIQMQMCIAEEGWSSVYPGANDCPTTATVAPNPSIPIPTAPLACVLYTTTVIDIGDGAVNRDF